MMDIKYIKHKGYSYAVADETWQYLSADEIACLFDTEIIKTTSCSIKTVGGRGSTFLYTDKNGEDLVYRHYRRGGTAGRILKDRFFKYASSAHRAFDELKLLLHMQQQNLPVPIPLAARESITPFFIKQDIIIKQIPSSANLCQILMERHLSVQDMENILNTCLMLYKNKIIHTDLNIKNILIDGNSKIYLIDFDKCYIKRLMSFDDYNNMLNRLLRSFEKEQSLHKDRFFFNKYNFVDLMHSHLKKI